jgi:hypothetical protein
MVKANTVKDGVLFAVPDVPSEHQEQRFSGMQVSGLRLSMVKANTVKDGVLFAVPDVPSEHQEQRGTTGLKGWL